MFTLTDDQKKKVAEWAKNHDCTITHVGALGGLFTYSFTPTGLGVAQVVSCECGKKINLTDYDSW